METKKIFLIIIFFCFGLAISGGIGYFLGVEKEKSQIERLVKIPEEIFMRAGEVVEIEGNIIHLKANVLEGKIDPKTGETETEILKITVDENTKINLPEEPQWGYPLEGEFEDILEAKFEDIKVGDLLYVLSSENIKGKQEFKAEEITILK
ncbi:hypothetical protein KJA15_03005 [Patescibacteria group bacterium]|nr:hypothetical protein [Patescibacteria group bacterium]